eukprot:Opistho-1_new@91246
MVQTNFSRLLAFDSRILKQAKKSNSSLTGDGKPVSKRRGSPEQQLSLFKSVSSGLIGVDEVGRGCLSGPVVAAAVILPAVAKSSFLAEELSELDDSKALSQKQRERLAEVLRANCHFAIAEATPAENDQIN